MAVSYTVSSAVVFAGHERAALREIADAAMGDAHHVRDVGFGGAFSVNLPCASVLVEPTSSMPCESESNVTSSPAAGLPVVPLVTVPVMFWAKAKVPNKRTKKSA